MHRLIPSTVICLLAWYSITAHAGFGFSSRGWVEEREISPYLIRSEFPLRDVQELVNELGDLQADMERLLKIKCEPNQIQIHLFRSHSNYADHLSKRGLYAQNRRALYMPGSESPPVGRVYAYRQKDLETDVRHETTHALLHSALPFVPMWLDEGFAEYFEVSPGQREKQNPHHAELRWAIRFGWRPAIEQLEEKNKLEDLGKAEYRDSWAVAHFLLHGPPAAQEALAVYLKEIQSGKVPTPLSKHLRKRIPNLDQVIVDHLQK